MWRYVAAAFNLKPPGFPLPLNWLFLGAAAVLGGALAQPGIWLIAGAVEVAYLWFASRNERLRRAVDAGSRPAPAAADWARERAALMAALEPGDRAEQDHLEERCREIAGRLAQGDDPLADTHGEAVRRAAWMHLKLLAARIGVRRLVAEGGDDDLPARIARLGERRDAAEGELRASIEAQLRILEQRHANRQEAQRRLQLLEADLERLRQQVELARDQALLAGGGDGLGRHLDLLGSELGDTGRWAFAEHLAADPYAAAPPLPSTPPARAREHA
jgi:hypothetical protein